MLQAALLWYKKFRKDLEEKDSNSIHMIHVWQIKRSRDHNIQFCFMLMILSAVTGRRQLIRILQNG